MSEWQDMQQKPKAKLRDLLKSKIIRFVKLNLSYTMTLNPFLKLFTKFKMYCRCGLV